MNDNIPARERIALLDELNIKNVRHFGRPLKEHLVGTHDLLEQWGASEDLCLAGLFHSVYGTKTFKLVSLESTQRRSLRRLVGRYAELLIYFFCMSDRRKLLIDNRSEPYYWVRYVDHERTEISPGVLGNLVELEAANYVEQLPFGTVKSDSVFHDMQIRFESAESLLSARAREAVKQAIASHAHLFQQVNWSS